ncbi:MAG: hypothetical protein ACRD20_03880 [Terriglobales bacterium]
MRPHVRSAHLAVPFLIGLCVSQVARAQSYITTAASTHAQLNAEEIVTNMVRRNLERAHALGAYQGTRIYRLDYSGFLGSRSAEMTVDVTYRSPGFKEFHIRTQKGSQFLIDRVFQRLIQSEKEAMTEESQGRVALNNDNYIFTLEGFENTAAGSSYILSVEPRTKDKLLYRGRIWVNAADFAVMRIEAAPAKNPSFWTKETKIEQVYAKVGDFWLPVSNRSTSSIRLGGHAYFAIDYQDYRIAAATTVTRKVGEYR